jgi:hypothetical protein
MLKHWLTLIVAFLRLGVADGDAAPGADAEPPADPADEDPNLDLDLGALDDEPPPADDPAPSKAELEASKREARENREARERAERELAETRASHRPAESEDDRLRRDEDARLASKDVPELDKWQIRANRTLREGRSTAAQALAQAQDISDKTSFSLLATKEPALFKRYEARVEEELAKVRAKGQNAPRESIYTYLLGQDMRAGKLTRKKAAPAADPNKTQVPRGKMPGARSDVGARSGMSDREKRAKRLENVQI